MNYFLVTEKTLVDPKESFFKLFTCEFCENINTYLLLNKYKKKSDPAKRTEQEPTIKGSHVLLLSSLECCTEFFPYIYISSCLY